VLFLKGGAITAASLGGMMVLPAENGEEPITAPRTKVQWDRMA